MRDDQLERYSRHVMLPQVGTVGQERLLSARVLLVGLGGLGSPAALYLAAAGVGTLGLADADVVDVSNLQRQVLHDSAGAAAGTRKTASGARRLAGLNPDVRTVEHGVRLTAANAMEIVSQYDVVVDGSDNFSTRYLINDACVFAGKPLVYGALHHFEGQVSVFWPGGRGSSATSGGLPVPPGPKATASGWKPDLPKTTGKMPVPPTSKTTAAGGMPREFPCYRCLFPEPPPAGAVPSCAEAGVLGVLPGVVGTLQATEAIKLVLGLGEPLVGRLLLYDALAMTFRTIALRASESCPVCGPRATIRELADYEAFCGGVSAGRAAGGHGGALREMEVEELRRLLAGGNDASAAGGEEISLLDVRNPDELATDPPLAGAHAIPLPELVARLAELENRRERRIVVYCRSGARSAQACGLLREAGFLEAVNLRGGYLRWKATENA